MSYDDRHERRARAVLRSDKLTAEERCWFDAAVLNIAKGRPLKATERRPLLHRSSTRSANR